MASVTYAIVFSGEIVKGFEVISVKARLAKMLKADAAKIQILFSGKSIVLKRTSDKAEATKYGTALKKAGANVRVKIIKSDATAPHKAQAAANLARAAALIKASAAQAQRAGAKATGAPTAKAPATRARTAKAATAPTAKVPAARASTAKIPATRVAARRGTTVAATTRSTDGFTLRPNEGNLFDAAPEVEALDLDLSGFSVAENDGQPLIEPKVYKKANIDLSEFSVAENDGSPIVEPAPRVAKVAAPDFGLDKPGAILETLKQEVELLDPDTSSMSLAFPGTDLLNEDEKKVTAPRPLTPDFNMKSNFDRSN